MAERISYVLLEVQISKGFQSCALLTDNFFVGKGSLFWKDIHRMSLQKLSLLQYAVVDFETTGLYPERGDQIIEIGVVLMRGKEILDETFHSLVNPLQPLPQASYAVHGISENQLKTAPTIEQVFPRFLQFVGTRVVVAHNAKFDYSFIEKNCRELGLPFCNMLLDTLALSKYLFSYEKRHNLDEVSSRLQLKKSGGRHRSLGDCHLTALVLSRFIDLLEKKEKDRFKFVQACFFRPKISSLPEEAESSLSLF